MFLSSFMPYKPLTTVYIIKLLNTHIEKLLNIISILKWQTNIYVLQKECPHSSNNCYCPSIGYCEYFNYTVLLSKLVEKNTHKGDQQLFLHHYGNKQGHAFNSRAR